MIDIDNLRVNFESKVLASGKVIVVPHKVADFDAIGSAIGLSLAVKKLKKVPLIIVDDKKYELDRGVQDIIKAAKVDYSIINKQKYLQAMHDDDLFIMTDVNKSYLASVSDLMVSPEKVIIIDHHEPDEKTVEADDKYIDSSYSSASEIVTRLLNKMKVKIPSDVANYLLAGIYLDTNKLTKNVTQDTLYVAGKLVEAGANVDVVTEMFSEDFEDDRRFQNLVNKARILTYKVAIMLADSQDEYTKKELAKAADYSLLHLGIDASFAVGKLNDDIVAISARAKDKIDVEQVMKEFGGGGHPYSAASGNIKGETIEEVGKKLELILRPSCSKEKSTEN